MSGNWTNITLLHAFDQECQVQKIKLPFEILKRNKNILFLANNLKRPFGKLALDKFRKNDI